MESRYYKSETLSGIFDAIKIKIANSNLTLKEVALNSEVPEELINMFFDNSNNIINDLSRFIEFSNTVLLFRNKDIKLYKSLNRKSETYILVSRIIKPFCTVKFDKTSHKMFDFNSKTKLKKLDKQLIINEMHEFITKKLN